MLEVEGLEVRYGAIGRCAACRSRSRRGELVALLGANGAGKSSTLMAIAGAVRPAGGRVRLDGADVTGARPERDGAARRRHGAGDARRVPGPHGGGEPAARRLHPPRRGGRGRRGTAARFLERFPILAERADQPAGTLSGGEQQMLVIARAMMARPRVLLLDEPSLGLAPVVVDRVFEMIAGAQGRGADDPARRAECRARRWRWPTAPTSCGSAGSRRPGSAPELATAGALQALYLGSDA